MLSSQIASFPQVGVKILKKMKPPARDSLDVKRFCHDFTEKKMHIFTTSMYKHGSACNPKSFKGRYTPQKLTAGTQKLAVWVNVSPFPRGLFQVPAASFR